MSTDLDTLATLFVHSQALAQALTDKLAAKYPARRSFLVESPRKGAKYVRLCQTRNGVDSTSVHCFIELATGNVYKPAGWRGPAKHVRANIATEEGLAAAIARCDPYGSWLYIR